MESPLPTVPCHAGDGTWGNVYEGTPYPLTFVLAGSSAVAAWNVDTSDPTDTDVRLCNVYTDNIAYFTFTRLSNPNPYVPLEDGELVTVTLDTTDPVQSRQVFWEEQTSPNLKVSYLLLTYVVTVPNLNSTTFAFSSSKRCCDVHINFVPALGGDPPTIKPPLTFMCTDPRPLDWASPVDIYHRVVWPNWPVVPTTPALQKLDVTSAIGEWVWDPDFNPANDCASSVTSV